jgi:ubiquinone biosynthesis protein UbiJ
VSEAIIVAVITGGLSLAGVVITCLATASKTEKAQAVAQAVTEAKLETLTQEVRKHNGFAEKIPVLHSKVESLEQRVDKLEKYHAQPN